MISFIKGKIVKNNIKDIIIEVGNIGYHVFITRKLYENIKDIDSEVSIFTYLDVKENSIALYGFFDEKEREIFKLLLSVSGISTKTAHNILCHIGFDEIIRLITGKQSLSSIKIPGLGLKKMEIISTSLKDKIVKLSSTEYLDSIPSVTTKDLTEREQYRLEALTALMNLGYVRMEAEKLIREAIKLFGENKYTTGDLIKKALEIASI
ncbi:MAG: Holliday junction branch migration protein RuvA [Ignavibacteria bacterium]|nr:Holliday junction branch migration protein RuvA [Ignavibacteria bacterium]